MEDKIEVLISEEVVEARIKELAEQIMKEHGEERITFICVLKGASFFATELAKRVRNDVEMEFIQVSSYGEGTVSSGNIALKKDIETSIVNKNVIIVEDIIDTGYTMKYLIKYFNSKNPKSLKVCTLLDKPERREVEVPVNYIGISIPNEFVVGYGLDYNEKYRNLPYIGKVIL